MCGIAGYNGQFSRQLLVEMNLAIAHRGPDDQGIFLSGDGKMGLAHRRLSIIDLSDAAAQPMKDPNTANVLTFNGEIYNYRSLREELIKKGCQFRTTSDTEVLLKLYAIYGTQCLEYLEGIFAFAIFDAKNDHLFLARDHFGVKPLYYSQVQLGFLFASELKALLQCPNIPRTLDCETIHYHLKYLWAPAPKTMLQSVKKLQPGHAMLIKAGAVQRHWQYYDLPQSTSYDQGAQEVLSATLVDKLSHSIEQQLVSDVPVGAFLSGGLDSSAIVALAKQAGYRLPCFTMRLPEEDQGQVSDLPYAEQVAAHLDLPLHVVDAKPQLLQNLSAMIYALDEPQADPAAINTYLIAQLAAQMGFKVLMSGAGGDDIFSGYRRHYALMLNRKLLFLPKLVRSSITLAARGAGRVHPKCRRLSKGLRYLDASPDAHLLSYFYWLSPEMLQRMFESENGILQEQDLLHQSLSVLPESMHALNKMLYLESKHFLTDHNLNYTDKLAMLAGIEVRVPFLDQDLISFASHIPVGYKQRAREGKWLFKQAMRPYLPENVIFRPKTGFGVPLRRWLHADLSNVLDSVLSTETLTRRGIFNAQAVRQLIHADKQGRIDATYPILSLICIELWCQIFIDSSKPIRQDFQ